MKYLIQWHKLADDVAELAFSHTGLLELEIAGKNICLIQQAGQLRACAASCPHAGGKLAMGHVDAQGNMVCPLHRYKFNLQSGRNSSGEGYFLRTYPVELRPDGVFIGFT